MLFIGAWKTISLTWRYIANYLPPCDSRANPAQRKSGDVCRWRCTQGRLCFNLSGWWMLSVQSRINLLIFCAKTLSDLSGHGWALWKSPWLWRFQLHKPKSALIRRGRHAEWHLLMTRPIQDTRALLGQVTGSVTLNKPTVPTEAERAGSWSACINFRRLQGLAVSIVVTIAEPSCLLGWHAVTPATVMFTQEA